MEVNGNGLIAAYIHTGAKVGVLVEVGAGKAETAGKDEFKQLVKDITLQIAAGHPHAVSREQVPAEVIAKEREIAAQSDRLKGKPAQAMEKILPGVLEKFYQTYCLVDQGFVKRNSEVSVKEHVAQIAKQLGDEVTIRRFVRFQVGESACVRACQINYSKGVQRQDAFIWLVSSLPHPTVPVQKFLFAKLLEKCFCCAGVISGTNCQN